MALCAHVQTFRVHPSPEFWSNITLQVCPRSILPPRFWRNLLLLLLIDSRGDSAFLQEGDEESTTSLTALWDAATYAGRATSLLRNVVSLYPEVRL